jgi:hypothetical protein
MTNYQKFIAVGFCLCSFSVSQAQTEKTITIPSSDSFRNNVAQIQTCYMNKQTQCGDKNISNLYISNNPKKHWQAITKNSSSRSTRLPELPSNINYSTPPTKTTTQTASAPTATKGSLFVSDESTGSTAFIVG